MGEMKTYKPGEFCWVELATLDPQASKEFYNKIFGWEAVDNPVGEGMVYTSLRLDGKPVGALYQMNKEMAKRQIPPHWMSYVSVENVDDTLETVIENGGMVAMDPIDIFDEGRMALLMDPEGASLGLWQPKRHAGAAWWDVPNSVCWVEHASRDSEHTIPFLEKVFNWKGKTEKMGETVYTTFARGEKVVAGLYNMTPEMEGVPSHWLPYFLTENIDELILKALELGGEVLMPKTNAEGVGDFTVVRDPQGAVFGAVQGEG